MPAGGRERSTPLGLSFQLWNGLSRYPCGGKSSRGVKRDVMLVMPGAPVLVDPYACTPAWAAECELVHGSLAAPWAIPARGHSLLVGLDGDPSCQRSTSRLPYEPRGRVT